MNPYILTTVGSKTKRKRAAPEKYDPEHGKMVDDEEKKARSNAKDRDKKVRRLLKITDGSSCAGGCLLDMRTVPRDQWDTCTVCENFPDLCHGELCPDCSAYARKNLQGGVYFCPACVHHTESLRPCDHCHVELADICPMCIGEDVEGYCCKLCVDKTTGLALCQECACGSIIVDEIAETLAKPGLSDLDALERVLEKLLSPEAYPERHTFDEHALCADLGGTAESGSVYDDPDEPYDPDADPDEPYDPDDFFEPVESLETYYTKVSEHTFGTLMSRLPKRLPKKHTFMSLPRRWSPNGCILTPGSADDHPILGAGVEDPALADIILIRADLFVDDREFVDARVHAEAASKHATSVWILPGINDAIESFPAGFELLWTRVNEEPSEKYPSLFYRGLGPDKSSRIVVCETMGIPAIPQYTPPAVLLHH